MMVLRILTLPLSLTDADQLYFLEKLDGIDDSSPLTEMA